MVPKCILPARVYKSPVHVSSERVDLLLVPPGSFGSHPNGKKPDATGIPEVLATPSACNSPQISPLKVVGFGSFSFANFLPPVESVLSVTETQGNPRQIRRQQKGRAGHEQCFLPISPPLTPPQICHYFSRHVPQYGGPTVSTHRSEASGQPSDPRPGGKSPAAASHPARFAPLESEGRR